MVYRSSPSTPHPKPKKPQPSYSYSQNTHLSPSRNDSVLSSGEEPRKNSFSKMPFNSETGNIVEVSLRKLNQHDQQLQQNLERIMKRRMEVQAEKGISLKKSPIKTRKSPAKQFHQHRSSPKIFPPNKSNSRKSPMKKAQEAKSSYSILHGSNVFSKHGNVNHYENNLDFRSLSGDGLFENESITSTPEKECNSMSMDRISPIYSVNNHNIKDYSLHSPRTRKQTKTLGNEPIEISVSGLGPTSIRDPTVKVKTVDLFTDNNFLHQSKNFDDKAKLMIAMESLKLDLEQIASPLETHDLKSQSARSHHENKSKTQKRIRKDTKIPPSAREQLKPTDNETYDSVTLSSPGEQRRGQSYLNYIEFKNHLRNKANSIEMKRKKMEEERKRQEELRKKAIVQERLKSLREYTQTLFNRNKNSKKPTQPVNSKNTWLDDTKPEPQKEETALKRKPSIPHFSFPARTSRASRSKTKNNLPSKSPRSARGTPKLQEKPDKQRSSSVDPKRYQSTTTSINESPIVLNPKSSKQLQRKKEGAHKSKLMNKKVDQSTRDKSIRKLKIHDPKQVTQPVAKQNLKLFDKKAIDSEMELLDAKISNDIDVIINQYIQNAHGNHTLKDKNENYNQPTEVNSDINSNELEVSEGDVASIGQIQQDDQTKNPYKDFLSELAIDEVLSELSEELEAYTSGGDSKFSTSNFTDGLDPATSFGLPVKDIKEMDVSNNQSKFKKDKDTSVESEQHSRKSTDFNDPVAILEALDFSSDDE